MNRELTCIECPMGCLITVEGEDTLTVRGNRCPRGAIYAKNEVTCPRRVVTSTVRLQDGRMLPVKTNQPVRKSEMFAVIEKINALHPAAPVHCGDILLYNIDEDAALVACDNIE